MSRANVFCAQTARWKNCCDIFFEIFFHKRAERNDRRYILMLRERNGDNALTVSRMKHKTFVARRIVWKQRLEKHRDMGEKKNELLCNAYTQFRTRSDYSSEWRRRVNAQIQATFACVIPSRIRLNYTACHKPALNHCHNLLDLRQPAPRAMDYRPFLSHDLRPNVLCIPFTGKGLHWEDWEGRQGRERGVIPRSAASR